MFEVSQILEFLRYIITDRKYVGKNFQENIVDPNQSDPTEAVWLRSAIFSIPHC